MMERQANLVVSVVIPVHADRHNFVSCLTSVVKAVSKPHEIIVVGDGVGDEYDALVAQYDIRYLKLPQCQGPARARNAGARVAKGDILFFLDSDVTVPSYILGQILQEFDREPALDALIGSYDDSPSATNFLSQYKNLFHYFVHQTSSQEASTFWGACGAVRKTAFWQVGGFDVNYRQPSIEDIEFGYRLKRRDYRIKLAKDVQVKHLKRWRPSPFLQTEIFGRALPWVHLIWRDRKLVDDLNLNHTSRLSTILVFSLLLGLFSANYFPQASLLMFVAIIGLFWLNRSLYRFLWQKRGFIFLLKSIPWHWFYYLYSGIAFILGTLQFATQKSLVSQYPERSVAPE